MRKWENRHLPNANGAGIAADPTLTNAWSISEENELGIRCFAILPHVKCGCQVRHRRSHRHPDPPSGTSTRLRRTEPSLSTFRTITGRFRGRTSLPNPRAVTLHQVRRPSNSIPIGYRPDRSARDEATSRHLERYPSTGSKPCIWLPRQPRGQVPPRLSGSNYSRSFRPLGLQSRKAFAPFR